MRLRTDALFADVNAMLFSAISHVLILLILSLASILFLRINSLNFRFLSAGVHNVLPVFSVRISLPAEHSGELSVLIFPQVFSFRLLSMRSFHAHARKALLSSGKTG